MNASTWERLEQLFDEFPVMCASEVPSSREITEAAIIIGCKFHDDYVAFLRRYGGAVVGPNPIFGLPAADVMGEPSSVVENTRRFREDRWPGTENWYIVSEDGAGNPIGIAPDGRVMISDHDVDTISVLARDFEEFLVKYCLGSA